MAGLDRADSDLLPKKGERAVFPGLAPGRDSSPAEGEKCALRGRCVAQDAAHTAGQKADGSSSGSGSGSLRALFSKKREGRRWGGGSLYVRALRTHPQS